MERDFNYDLGDVINIPKLKDVSEAYMKEKWDFNDRMSKINHWTKVDMAIVKEYQWDVNQFSTKNGVSSNWLYDILHKSTAEKSRSKIGEAYLPMADRGYFGGCLYFKIALDMMFCMKTGVVQALHDSIKNFVRYDVSGEPCNNITTLVKFLLIFCAKLSEIKYLP